MKQGCPLSPDLYGIFGDAFADYVAAKNAADPAGMHAAECPVLTGGLPLPLLLYADVLQHGFDAGDMREAMAGDQRRLAKHLHAATRARRERVAVR